jgi:uncharacterized membrane protein YdbT with pleckstrin-like domain
MMPMWFKLKIPIKESEQTTLWLPLFLIWPMVLVLFILLIPIWLIGIIVAYISGYGRHVLRLPALLLSTFWCLRGLTVSIQSRNGLINFELV